MNFDSDKFWADWSVQEFFFDCVDVWYPSYVFGPDRREGGRP